MSPLSVLFAPLSIAPMIDWTNRHFRVFMRLIAPQALLYTEMHTPSAIQYNPLLTLSHSPIEHPLALQLGGSDIDALVIAAKRAEDAGFAEVNLNLGCPSDKVQAGRFGACLMAEGEHVGRCIAALKKSLSIPVSAKTRIGIDHQDSYPFFQKFCHQLINAGCDKLVVHARKAWLKGLSPKQNRCIPELHYEYVHQIKKELAGIPVIINGNLQSLPTIREQMDYVDGVMIGRLACQNPYALAEIHAMFFPKARIKSRVEVVEAYLEYMKEPLTMNVPLTVLLKPLFNFAHGLPQAKYWKEQLLMASQKKNSEYLDGLLPFLKDSVKQPNGSLTSF